MNNIPKILHLFWNGSAMSYLQVLTVISFKKHHPNWKIIVYYNNENLGKKYIPDYNGVDNFEILKTLPYVEIQNIDWNDFNLNVELSSILKSDILRYIKLYEIGGVWSDFDVFWIQNLNILTNIIGSSFEFTTCKTQYFNKTFTSIGILLTKAKNEYYKELVEVCYSLLNNNLIESHQVFGATLWDNLYPTFKELKAKYSKVANIPYTVFYPYPVMKNGLHSLFSNVNLFPMNDKVIAIHWFNGHKITKEWINNEMKKECSMTYIINNY